MLPKPGLEREGPLGLLGLGRGRLLPAWRELGRGDAPRKSGMLCDRLCRAQRHELLLAHPQPWLPKLLLTQF